jgi:hypothetical protein
MAGFGKTSAAPAPMTAGAPCDRDADIYDRHADALYRQALLTLGDAGLAERVVCDVIVDECVWPPASAGDGDDARYRLALSTYGRCRELAGESAWQDGTPAGRRSESCLGRIESCGPLSGREWGALGLILFGGLGYVPVSHQLAISPPDMAALLRGALRELTASPCTRSPCS